MLHTNEVSAATTKNSSNGCWLVSSTGISPSHGSHATAPIACDGFTASEWTPLARFRLKAKSSHVSSLLLLPQSLIDFAGTLFISLITFGLWLDGSIIVPIACRRYIGSRPILIAECVSLLAEKSKDRITGIGLLTFSKSWRSR